MDGINKFRKKVVYLQFLPIIGTADLFSYTSFAS